MWDIYGQPNVDSAAMTYVGQPRCYDFFLQHRKCWANADRAEDCLPQRKDFIECIYQAKERRRTNDIVEHAKKLRGIRQKEEPGRNGQLPDLGLVSAIDIPDDGPSDYPNNKYPDDARSRGLGWRGSKGIIRGWTSEKANPKQRDPEDLTKGNGQDVTAERGSQDKGPNIGKSLETNDSGDAKDG